MFCMLTCLYDNTYVEIKFNHSKLSNFVSSRKMVTNTIKRYKRLFLHKTDKKNVEKTRGRMFCTLVGMMSLMLNSKL